MVESAKSVKSKVGGKPLHELQPELLLAILDTLTEISAKLDKCQPRK